MLRVLLLASVLSAHAQDGSFPDCPPGTQVWEKTLPGPLSPAEQPAWLANMSAYRAAARAQFNYSGAVYDQQLHWTERAFIGPQAHIYDRFLYDAEARNWTVDRFLDDLEARYGSVDWVLLWGTYTNLGVDERNQFQMAFDDTPGGEAAWRDVLVPAFHARGVRVGAPYNPWDQGTAPSPSTDDVELARVAAAVGLDFANGDGMACLPRSFFDASVAAGRPLSFQPEAGSSLYSLPWVKNSWGESWVGCESGCVPPVAIDKWVESRHLTQVVNRFATDHTTDLMQAFFNGIGFVTWENVWSFWNGLSARDAEATRRVGALLRFLAPLLVSPAWEPHARLAGEAAAASVYASRWPSPAGVAFSSNATAWTLVSTALGTNFSGPAIIIPCASSPPTLYFDLYRGAALAPAPYGGGGGCALALSVEAGGFGAVIGVSAADAAGNSTLAAFLQRMAGMTARALASFSRNVTLLPQTMTVWPRAPALPPAARGGMLAIPAAPAFVFAVNGTEIEGRQFALGDDVQYPWEELPRWQHATTLAIDAFLIDVTPVTNAAFAAFLQASGYAPADAHNFLRDWNGSATPPAGWERKPVTWVDLSDARAFCSFHGKRLPNEWEWQYAAQGSDGRQYPWGPARDDSRIPPPLVSRVRGAPMDVGSFANGSSPFGLLDALGLVWQWTNAFADAHTASAVLRGSSYYHPPACPWYFPNAQIAAVNCSHWWPAAKVAPWGTLAAHNKLMTMAPSYDRHGTVGFRCAADVDPPPGQ
jgi:iron(II)-dependent oxidoreductase